MRDPRLAKLLTLALDAGTPQHESDAAAAMFIRLCRKAGMRVSDLLGSQGSPDQGEAPRAFPFGKYRGRAVKDVVRHDPGYCAWAAENMSKISPDLRNYIRQLLMESFAA